MKAQGISFWLAAVALLLSSCGPHYYARKAEKAIRKLEQHGGKWRVDTAWVAVEIPVPVVRMDTVVVTAESDTVILERERLRVQVIRQYDTLTVEAECRADTIEVEVPVYITNEITAPKKPFPWTWLFIAVIAVAAAFTVWKLK